MTTIPLLLLALAAPPELAKQRFLEAEVDFKVGRFERALAGYTDVYELSELPGLLFNMAQCHRNLGQYDRAIYFLERYLNEAIDDRRAIERLLAELEEEQHRAEPTVVVKTATVTRDVFIEKQVEPPVHEQPLVLGCRDRRSRGRGGGGGHRRRRDPGGGSGGRLQLPALIRPEKVGGPTLVVM